MANVMNMTKLRNKPSRNGFDLSRKVAFTAKIAELLPVECIECIPGDSFKIRKQHFTRTMPVNTAAYTRIREYYDWFFVPTNLLWNKFNTFVSQMTDNGQHALGISENMTLGQQHPYFTNNQIITYLNSLSAHNGNKNIFGFNRGSHTSKLLEYLGYKTFSVGSDVAGTNVSILNATLNPFPLLAYQKIYQDYFRNSQWEKAYAPAWNIDYMSGTNMELPISQIDKDVENMFDLRYCNWNKDYFMGLLPNSQFGSPASVDLSSLINAQPLDTFQIGSGGLTGNAKFSSTSPNNGINSILLNENNADANLKLSAQVVGNLAKSMGLTNSSLQSAFTILALRQAEAAQKWAEITQSQQQDYKSQMEAHFGVDLSDAYSERCRFIDGQVSNLDISEVLNQSLNGTDAASIKGKGVGVGDGYINFKTDVHGYLMCIYHAVPILDYQTSGIRKQNLKTMVTDYAIPEFDRTGMVKMNFIELMSVKPRDNYAGMENVQLGYAPQYYEYKTSYDEVLGAFVNTQLSSWVAPFKESFFLKYFKELMDNGLDSITYHFFKVNPAILNPIFVAQIGSGSDAFMEEQLLINCSFENHAVRNLDYNGLPY